MVSSKKIKITILSAASIVATFSIASRLLGLLRDRLLTSTFGAGLELDSYFAAFKVPDVIFNLIVVGALSSAFIPIFTEMIERKKLSNAWRLTNSLIAILFWAVLTVCAMVFFFMPVIINLVVPGFDAESKDLVINLSRIMLISPIFFSLSNIASGVLNSFNRFLAYSITPVVYNLGIIGGILFLTPKLGIYGVAYGVVIGSVLHLIVQFPSLKKVGYLFRPSFDFAADGVKKVLKLMGPRVLGLAAYQVNLFVSNAVASTLAIGSIAVYSLANNLQSVIYSAIGVAMATAAFPVLATIVAKTDKKQFIRTYSKTLRRILFFVIPLSILMILLRAQIVRIILGTGKFDWDATVLTASALGFFTISLFAQALIPLSAKAFYALQDTKTPVIISIISMTVNVVLNFYLADMMGVAGLALAFSIASFLNMILLIFVLHLRMGELDDKKIIVSVGKMIIAAIVMILVVQGVTVNRGEFDVSLMPGIKTMVAGVVDMHRFWGVFVQAAASAIGGLAVFVLVAWLMRLEELKLAKGIYRRLLKFFGLMPFVAKDRIRQ